MQSKQSYAIKAEDKTFLRIYLHHSLFILRILFYYLYIEPGQKNLYIELPLSSTCIVLYPILQILLVLRFSEFNKLC
jgi:hypothetical protein